MVAVRGASAPLIGRTPAFLLMNVWCMQVALVALLPLLGLVDDNRCCTLCMLPYMPVPVQHAANCRALDQQLTAPPTGPLVQETR